MNGGAIFEKLSTKTGQNIMTLDCKWTVWSNNRIANKIGEQTFFAHTLKELTQIWAFPFLTSAVGALMTP